MSTAIQKNSAFATPTAGQVDYSGPPAVDIRNLSFCYHGLEPALENVSLSLRNGEFLALIGPNGGGKTTLLRLILGLLPPRQGSVRVFGKAPSSVSSRIGYVPQFSTLRLDFPATVLDTVLMGGACPSLFGGGWSNNAKARQRAMSYLDILGLAGCAKAPVGGLSGGQRQRALVARALMSRPEHHADAADSPFLLLLDEPTASIDPQGKFCFYEFLGKLRGSITMIVVSHDLFLASPFFSSIAFVNKTLTRLEGDRLSPENLTALFGQHLHECPVADMQHADGAQHHDGCSHPACAPPENQDPPLQNCAFCDEGTCSPEFHGLKAPSAPPFSADGCSHSDNSHTRPSQTEAQD